LIHTKREQFAERIKGRTQHYEPTSPVLAKRSLLSLAGLLFISVFGGMLWWQYPDAPQSLLTHIAAKFSEPDESLTETPSMVEHLPQLKSNQGSIVLLNQADSVASETSDELAKHVIAADRLEEKIDDPNALITDWKSALSQIDKASQDKEKSNAALTLADTLDKGPTAQANAKKPIVDSQDQNILLNEQAARPGDELHAQVQDGVVDDYPVEDITSVEQLTGQTAPVKPLVDIGAVGQPSANNYREKMPVYAYNEEALLLLPEDKYLLQIAAMNSVQTMRAYIQDNRLQDQLWIYKTQRQGNAWFVLLHSKDYLSLLSATQASATLPKAMQGGIPFAKTSRQVQAEINQSAN